MSKNRIKLLTFLLLGSILLTGCQKHGKTEQINGAYAEYPADETLSQIETFVPDESYVPDETIEIMPPFLEETIPSYVVPETTNPNITIPEETIDKEDEYIPEETINQDDTIDQEEQEQDNPQIVENNNIIVQAISQANLRSSNTQDSIWLDQLQIYDTAYRILSCDNGWDLVKFNDKIGYVYRDFIHYTEESYSNEYNHIKYEDIVLTTGNLNFRTEPTSESKKIATFPENTELQVIAAVENSEWLLVKYNGQLGYVHSGYVVSMLYRANDWYPELQLTNLKTQKVVYTNVGLNFRTGNSTEFPSLGLLEKYETLRVMGEYDGWYFVMTNDYSFGFVSANYTTTLEERFVIVDKSEQQLFLYDDNELLYTTPVTTGKDETPSDTGLFKIRYKSTDVVLSDNETYWSPVKYWMPYNGGEGLHDADWRSVFGTESYHYGGSHGCINMPPEITDEIFNNVEKGTKVLVHK